MHNYKVYVFGDDGHIINLVDLNCLDDEAAADKGRQLADGRPIELWDGARKIARFEPPSRRNLG